MENFYILDNEENLCAIISKETTDETTVPLLSAKTNEQLASYDVITLEILASHPDVTKIPEDGSIIAEDEFMGWREYHISKIEDTDNQGLIKVISGELSSVELEDTKCEFEYLPDTQLSEQVNIILSGTRFSLGIIDPSIKDVHILTWELRHSSVLEGIYFLANKYQCEVYFSYRIEGNRVTGRFVNFIHQLGSDKGKRFEVGKDVTSIKREVDYTGIKTAIIPTGNEKQDAKTGENFELNIESIEWKKDLNPVDKPKGQNWIGDPVALERWGRKDEFGKKIHRFVHVNFNVNEAAELIKLGWMELGKYKNPKITYTLDVVDLYKLTSDEDLKHESVVLGDVVAVIDRYFPNPLLVTARVIKIDRDLIDPSKTKITLGDIQQTYTSQGLSREDKFDNIISAVLDKASNFVSSIANTTNNYYGSQEPTKPHKDDTWVRPHPEKPSETQFCVWDGTQWVVEIDTSIATDAFERTKTIDKDIEAAKQDSANALKLADESAQKANDLADKANKAINDLTDNNQNIDDIKTLAEQANTLATEAAESITEQINKAEAAQNYTEKTLGDLQDLAKSNETEIKNIEGELSSKVSQSDYDVLNKALKSQETIVTQVADNISSKADQKLVDQLNNIINLQGTQISQNSSKVETKADKAIVDQINKTVSQQGTQLVQTADQIKAKADKAVVDAMGKIVESSSAELQTQSNKISGIVSQQTSTENRVASMEIQSGSLKSTIASFENRLNNEIPSTKNLLANSSLYRGLDHWRDWGTAKNATRKIVEIKDLPGITHGFEFNKAAGVATTGEWGYAQDGVPVKPNTKYTISFWAKAQYGHMTVGIQQGNGNSEPWDFKNFSSIAQWQRFSYTFTTKASTSNTNYYAGFKQNDTGIVTFAGFQFEEGNLTDYQPSIEELLTPAELSTIVQTVKSFQTTVSNKAEKSEVTQLSTQVLSAITSASGAESKVNQLNDQISTVVRKSDGMESEFKQLSDQVKTFVKANAAKNEVSNPDGIHGLDNWSNEPLLSSSKWQVSDDPSFSIEGSKGFKFHNDFTLFSLTYYLRSATIPLEAGVPLSASSKVKIIKAPSSSNVTFRVELFDDDLSLVTTEYREVKADNNSVGWQELKVENYIPTEKYKYARITFKVDNANDVVFCQPQLIKGALTIGQYDMNNIDISSQITQMADQIISTVKKGDIVSTINQSAETILIDAKKIHISGETTIDNAAINSAAIQSLSADKITAGTLNARDIHVVNLDAGAITTGVLKAITLQGNNLTINLATGDVMFKKGQIRSSDDKFSIDIDSGEIHTYKTGSFGGILKQELQGIRLSKGAINFEKVTQNNVSKTIATISSVDLLTALGSGKMNTGIVFESKNPDVYDPKTGAFSSDTSGWGFYTSGFDIVSKDNFGAGFHFNEKRDFTKAISDHTANSAEMVLYARNKISIGTEILNNQGIGGNLILDNGGKAYFTSQSRMTINCNEYLNVYGKTAIDIMTQNQTGAIKLGGNVTVSKDLKVSGKKNAIHVTRDGVRETPAYETTESYLGDLGRASTGERCKVIIPIEVLFSDTVNVNLDYHVFLSSYSDDVLWVSKKTSDYFIVESRKPDTEFSWELKARRRGYEFDRLALAEEFNNHEIDKVFGEVAV